MSGVYAVTLCLKHSNRNVLGVANVGCKPTVGQFEPSLEVYIFDFDEDIYGVHVDVQLHYKIRDEQRFAGVDQLKAQIEQDSQDARAFFAREYGKWFFDKLTDH